MALWRQRAKLAAVAAVFGVPPLRRLELAFLGFAVAERATFVAILVYAYGVGGSSTVGVVAAVQLLPAAVAAPLIATAADRMPRHRALTIGYLSQAGAAGLTGWAMATATAPPLVVALAALTAILITATRPAHTALIPELSDGPDQTIAANVVTSMEEGVAGLAGPLIAGLLLGAGDPSLVFLTMAAVLAVSAVVVAGVSGTAGPALVMRVSGFRTLVGGLSAALSERRAGAIVGLGGVKAIVDGALGVLVVVLAIELLGIGEPGVGYLGAVVGAGALLGAIASAGLVGRPRLAPSLLAGALVGGVSISAVGLLPGAAPLLAVTGGAGGLANVAGRTLLQRLASREVMARVFGVLEGLAMAGLAVGALLAPVLIDWVGGQGALVVVGLLLPVAAIVAWPVIRHGDISVGAAEVEIGIIERVAMLRPLDPPVLEGLALGSHLENVERGRIVIRQGDPGDRVYVIDAGRYDVIADGHLVTTLDRGDVFGEIALIADVPRTATVAAAENGRLLAIDRATFLETLAQCPGTLATFEEVVGRRLSDLDEMG
jgi:Cyclic nucleotide-binding domain/Major Facilitator Superfamily